LMDRCNSSWRGFKCGLYLFPDGVTFCTSWCFRSM